MKAPAMPTVSVVMPVYNVERYLAAAIDSVLAQTFTDLELILVDDGSTDGSSALCAAYTDPRVRVIRQANRGLPGARNTGIRAATGAYIAILDSDDLWHPEKLARHVAHLQARPEVGVSYCASELIDGEGRCMGLHQRPKLTGIRPEDVLCRNPVGNGSVPVFRREALAAIAFTSDRNGVPETHYFDESFRYCEDIECWMRIAVTTPWRFEGVADCLTRYRVVSGGLSANTERMYEFWRKMRDKVATYAPGLVERFGKRAEGYQLRYYARRAVKEGRLDSARGWLSAAFTLYPAMWWEEPKRTAVTTLAIVALGLLPARVAEAVMFRQRGPQAVSAAAAAART